MTDKALEAALKAWFSSEYDPRKLSPVVNAHHREKAQAAISAYLSALPGEAEVAAWVRSDDLQEPPERRHVTAWEKVATSWAEGFHPCTPLVTLASLQAMQARAEKAERERDEAQTANASLSKLLDHLDPQLTASKLQSAQARVKELEEALVDCGTSLEMAGYSKAADVARTALTGGSNG